MTIRVIISGRVQGVGYRAWTVRAASALGLAGWVRNRNDGSVEALFSGDPARVQGMLEQCKTGPMLAKVDSVTSYTYEEPYTETGFVKKPTL